METNRECVLLRKETVVYCRAYPIKKAIPYERLSKTECKCFTAEYRNCEQYKSKYRDKEKSTANCPFIGMEIVYFCAAFPLKKVSMDSLTFSPCVSQYYERCEIFRRAVSGSGEKDPVNVRGFHFDSTKEYLSGHLWVKRKNGKVRVGLDDFGQFILGPIKEVRPHEKDGSVFIRCEIEEGQIEIELPLKGTIYQVNEKIRQDPSLVNSDPYGDGWLIDVILKSELRTICGEDAMVAIERDVGRLQRLLGELGISTMEDGGEIIREIRKSLRGKVIVLIEEFLKGKEVDS